MGLDVLYTNTDQFVNKRDDLCMMITGQEPDIILLTETIPKAQVLPISPALLDIPGYKIYCNFEPREPDLGRSGRRGICIYVKDTLRVSEVSFPDCPFEEQLWLRLPLAGSDHLLLGCVYRSPSGAGDLDTTNLIHLLEHIADSGYSHLLLTGDFNMPQINWELGCSTAPEGHYSHQFLNCTQDLFLHQHIQEPTRYRQGERSHILDLVFTNEAGMVQNIQYCPGLASSDHVVLRFDLECYTVRHDPQGLHLDYNRANFDQLNNLICDTDWTVGSSMSLEEKYSAFKMKLNTLVEKSIPVARPKSKKKNLYINRTALKLKKKKRKLWQEFTHSQDPISHALFARCRNDLRKLTRRLRKDFEQSLAGGVKTNPKAFWQYANSRCKTRSTIENLVDVDGSMASEDADRARVLNEFFSSVFTSEDHGAAPPILPTTSQGPELECVDFPVELVKQKLLNLRPTSSPGPDGLHPRLLAATAETLASLWAQIFTESMDSGCLPEDWKTANITPIFKKGNKQLPSNYRPISLTAVPCKTMESIIRDKLMAHLSSSDQLHDAQHGFRPRRSCVTQLLTTVEDWSAMVEAGDPIDILYLDFSKAFDSVSHSFLIRKLQAYGVTGRLLAWITAFLDGRLQRVLVNGCASDWVPVTSGVPQGSVLGPLLFVLYVNDLPSDLQCPTKLFADDTKLYRSVRHASDVQLLQRDLDRAVSWSEKWRLPFNRAKCSSLHVGRSNARQAYSMQDTVLEQVSTERDLGVVVDCELKFREQAASAVSKSTQVLAVIRRSFQLLDKTTLPLLFKTLVRPHLEYGNLVWGPFNRADQRSVERVQRRATRLVKEIRAEPYSERLRLLGLPSLYYRRRRGDMIAVYQMLHSGVDMDHTTFFKVSAESTTRGHPWKINKPQALTRIRRNTFSVRVVNDWNALPLHVVSASTVNMFKARLDSHWAHLQYTIPYQD